MNRTFEEYKAVTDHRLDSLDDEKIARLDAALDRQMQQQRELAIKSQRPPLALETTRRSPLQHEHKQAFNAYMRSGDAHALSRLETRAMSATTLADGGTLVPPELEQAIISRLALVSPIRAIAGNRQVSSAVYKRPYSSSARQRAGWAKRRTARRHLHDAERAGLSDHGTLCHAGRLADPAR